MKSKKRVVGKNLSAVMKAATVAVFGTILHQSSLFDQFPFGSFLSLGLVLLVFPWLSWPLAVLGFVGMGKASLDLFHAFWDGLDEVQRAELLAAANEAGVNLRRFFDGEQGQPGNQLA